MFEPTLPVVIRPDPNVANRVNLLGVSQCLGFCPMVASVYRSDDGGLTFTKVPSPLAVGNGFDMSMDPVTGALYVLSAGRIISIDRGEALELADVAGFTNDSAGALCVAP